MSICEQVNFKIFLQYEHSIIPRCYSLQNMLKKEPDYIISDPHVYSIQDLINIKFGVLYIKLQELVQICCAHTMECEVSILYQYILIINNINIL